MSVTVEVHGLKELLAFLNRVKDPSEWIPTDDDGAEAVMTMELDL